MQALARDHSNQLSHLRLAQSLHSINPPGRFIFLGPPGAGKRTQAALFAADWQIPHISTGAMLRQAIAAQTGIGIQAQTYVNTGELVPDLLMLYLLEERFRQPDTERGWILEGFPRNLAQAEVLEDLLNQLNQPCNLVVHFEVTQQIAIERILRCHRQNDTEEVIQKRLQIDRQQSQPILDFYQRRQKLYPINGNLPIESVNRLLKVSLLPASEDIKACMESKGFQS